MPTLGLMLAFCLGDAGTYQAVSKTVVNNLDCIFEIQKVLLCCLMDFFALSYLLVTARVSSFCWSLPSGINTTHGLFIKEHQSTLSRSTYLSVTGTNFYMPSQILHSFQTMCLTDNRNSWHILNEVSFRFKGKEISWIND